MAEPTPEPCGCVVEDDNEYATYRIIYCPTHAAARALRADMSNIFEAVMTEENMDMKSMRQTLDFVGAIAARALEGSRAAIAKAKGEPLWGPAAKARDEGRISAPPRRGTVRPEEEEANLLVIEESGDD